MHNKEMIDGILLQKMLAGGLANLSHNIDYLNGINVFPVSDGDTGTNMKNTFQSGIVQLKANPSFCDTFLAFVKGMMFGSRGNSGFILSQYFSGVYEYTKDKNAVAVADLSAVFLYAAHAAYRAMVNPVDGTMLTVMQEGIKRTQGRIGNNTSLNEFFHILAGEMYTCVQETINQMDVLRDNNVVDSGAVGIYLIFDGMRRALHDDCDYFDCENDKALPNRNKILVKNISFFRYCTEFMLKMNDEHNKDFFIQLLSKKGDSIIVTTEEGILKVHIHTNEPYEILDEFSGFGDLISKKIDDFFLTQEYESLKQRKYDGFTVLAFTCGEGNAATLETLGVDVAFTVPFGHYPSESGLTNLLDVFKEENLIVFSNNREVQEKLKRIQSNFKNLYIAESENPAQTFFILSSLILCDEFNNVIKSVERLKKRRVFYASIKAGSDLMDFLNTQANEKALEQYSTLAIFGGMNCKPEDIEIIHSHFNKNKNIEYTYYENQQYDYDYIIGAY